MAFEVPHKHDISLDGQEMRNQMIENFEAIEKVINELLNRTSNLENKVKDLQSSDINTEYITDTNVATDYTTDAPTSVDIDDTNGDDEIQGLTIQEGGK